MVQPARISHAPREKCARSADPAAAGSGLASRERIRPGEPLPRRLGAGDLLTNCKICEKVRLGLLRSCAPLPYSQEKKTGEDARSTLRGDRRIAVSHYST